MKIGLLTFHRAINYGAVLQCYALYMTLSNMGHNVEIIDYRPKSIEKYRETIPINKKKIVSFVKSCTKAFIQYNKKKQAIKRFDDFLSNMKLSRTVFRRSDFEALRYELIICGSDQLWNSRITGGIDPIYYGQFERNGAVFVTYAVSSGDQKLDSDFADKILPYIQNIDRISCRETDLCDFIVEQKLSCVQVIDPTILLDTEYYDAISQTPRENGYVFVYALKDEDEVVEYASILAKKMSTKVKVVHGMCVGKRFSFENVEVVEGVTPGEFIGYIKNASFCVLRSFHGTVFSTLYRKDFICLEHWSQGRYANYLEILGLSERIVPVSVVVEPTKINYLGVDERMEYLKSQSFNFLSRLTE